MAPLGKGNGFGSSLYGNTRGRRRAAATRTSSSVPHIAVCILPLCLSIPVPPFLLLCQPGAWGAAALVLAGQRRLHRRALWPCREAANHPGVAIASAHSASSAQGGPPSLPASSAAENELGGRQSVSETLQSRQKQLRAVSVSLTDWAPPWCV